ncbi:MAG: protein translocase subunit SecD [Lachnospiraceae bacterium]|jgi:SecD/SecF fusion protein|nr:protein translocase subunit SecD [Lachnospiraceae bacterium]HBV83708.1 protein translocase subunit SecDF [Lachnospiraceae bacterium]
MKKSKGITTLVLTVLIMVALGFVAIWGIGTEKAGSASGIRQGLDLAGGVSITYQVVGDENPSAEDMGDTIYKLQKRVETYSTEAQVYQEGADRINIEIPGVSDANSILEDLGRPGALYFIAQTDADGNQNYSYTGSGATGYSLNKTIEELKTAGSIVLEGIDVATAQGGSGSDSLGNSQFVVDLTFTGEGTTKFADATTKAFSKGETIGIYYDGDFISVPTVQAALTDGKAQITGMGSFEEAEKIASQIRIGGLKLELEELRSNVVGAQLGEEAVKTSLQAALFGLIIIAIFMIVVYRLPGLSSVLALIIYTCLIVISLNIFEITLTLPGIAGIILSIGMAVDANVIIFARIREEITAGKTVRSAIEAGFQKALSAIVDGNVTTLIAAFVLGIKGSGTVKGFAYTLALGIILSMFTALVVTRLILRSFFAVGFKEVKFFGTNKEKKTVNFLGKKNIFFAASIAVIVLGFVFMGVNGASTGKALNYSLDFVGGTSTNVTFNEDMELSAIDANVVPVFSDVTGDGAVQVQKVAGSNEVIFKTRELNVEERQTLEDALVENFGVNKELITAETISSTISSEMKSDAVVAVIIATVCMLIYIWFRFKDIRFAASSVAALVHDVLVVLAFYAVAKVSVGSTFIACMLTIVGYSINATIVIFDRIRENLGSMLKKDTLEDLVNRSISQTLSRSIFTSLTTFIMVAALYVLGVTSIKEFALPLMVGIVCGTYSSVCITGALWYVLRTKIKKA